MNHDLARRAFEEIRNRPYAWSSELGVSAHNCYFKGSELLQRLGILGYAVRGRVGETRLENYIPERIHKLYPKEFLLTHFYVEVDIDGIWKILDPSYDPPLCKHGFIVNNWDSNKSCFEIIRLYTQREQIDYQKEWNDPLYSRKYFEAIKPCAIALNEYLEELRRNSA